MLSYKVHVCYRNNLLIEWLKCGARIVFDPRIAHT